MHSQQRWGYSNAAVRMRLVEWVHVCVRSWFRHTLPCKQDTDISFCPITFNLHMCVVDDSTMNHIDFILAFSVVVLLMHNSTVSLLIIVINELNFK